MTDLPITRRRWLAAGAALAVPGLGLAAPYSPDGPARLRPLAAKSNCLDIVAAGPRLVAVGERGHVLLSDDQGTTWRQAVAVPTRTTLTAVYATDEKLLWAVGHGGMILRSADGGEHWDVATGKTDGADVLLSIRVDADGRGMAVGGFGVAMNTADGGKTWKTGALLEGEAGEKHLNHIFVSAAGTWLIAAEGGVLLRGTDRAADGTARWAAVKTPYAGSLWGGATLAGGALLACGMRGNVVRSADDGLGWTHRPIAGAGSLTGVAVLKDGRPVLVGVDGTVVVGDKGGDTYQLRQLDDRSTLTGVVALGDGSVAVSSASGMRRLDLAA